MFIIFIIFSLIVAQLYFVLNEMRVCERALEKDLARHKKGWELLWVKEPTYEERLDSPYYSFFNFRLPGIRSRTFIAQVRKEDQETQIWVKASIFLYWVVAIDYERRTMSRKLSQEQIEKLL